MKNDLLPSDGQSLVTRRAVAQPVLNGAQALVQSLIGAGVELCFANPGTSEMHFVAALDAASGPRCVLGLHETVVCGMADGYWRIARSPATALLHCGPGLGNGLANLHNAKRARSGILNIVGDQATYHRPYDAPLTADTESLARTVSAWTRTSSTAERVSADAMAGLQCARAGQIATLVLPSDASWNAGGVIARSLPALCPAPLDYTAVEATICALRRAERPLFLLGGDAVLDAGQRQVARLLSINNTAVMAEYGVGRVSRGRGRLPLRRLPYATDAAVAALREFDLVILAGARPPVGFFAYPGKPSVLQNPAAEVQILSRPDQDPVIGLTALADSLGLRAASVETASSALVPGLATGLPTPEALASTVAALLPEDSIVSDESISFGRSFYAHSMGAAPHEWLHQTGGAIGGGLPVATGAAIAGRGRRVVSLQADGSAMYSLQSLWTQARERLPCTTVILSNRQYKILIGEYGAVGAEPGSTAMKMLSLDDPSLDWVAIANGLGVEAARAHNMKECADLLRCSFGRSGPFLIELVL
jgi:acetolactate synthase-1/2/3 large subunit